MTAPKRVLDRLARGFSTKRRVAPEHLSLERKIQGDRHVRELMRMIARGDVRTDLGMRDVAYAHAMRRRDRREGAA